jgi:hypothetical protein
MGGFPSAFQASDAFKCLHTADLAHILESNRDNMNFLFPDLVALSSDDMTNIVSNHPSIFNVLCIMYGRTKIKSSMFPSLLDGDPFQHFAAVTIESADDIDSAIEECRSGQTESTKYVIIAECIEISDLLVIDKFFCKDSDLIGLNVSNNQISGESLSAAVHLGESSLVCLHIGGNTISSAHLLTSALPSSLLYLDLSFTESLTLECGVFLPCPQLLYLALDGCGIASTVCGIDPTPSNPRSPLAEACASSIFYGLACLVHLSIKENGLEDCDSLAGLVYFSLQSAHSLEGFPGYQDCGVEQTKLTYLDIAENALCDVAAELSAARTYAATNIPSLQRIDGFSVNSSRASSTTVDMYAMMATKTQLQNEGRGSSVPGGGVLADNLEKEFLAALKGERDTTVVS